MPLVPALNINLHWEGKNVFFCALPMTIFWVVCPPPLHVELVHATAAFVMFFGFEGRRTKRRVRAILERVVFSPAYFLPLRS